MTLPKLYLDFPEASLLKHFGWHGWKADTSQNDQYGYPNFEKGTNHWGKSCSQSWRKEAPTGTHRFSIWSPSRMQPSNLGSSNLSSTQGQQTSAQHQPMKQQHRPGDRRRGSSNSHLAVNQNQEWARPQNRYGMERRSAQISTTTSATGKAHRATKAYTSAPKSSAAADLVA